MDCIAFQVSDDELVYVCVSLVRYRGRYLRFELAKFPPCIARTGLNFPQTRNLFPLLRCLKSFSPSVPSLLFFAFSFLATTSEYTITCPTFFPSLVNSSPRNPSSLEPLTRVPLSQKKKITKKEKKTYDSSTSGLIYTSQSMIQTTVVTYLNLHHSSHARVIDGT